MKVGILAGEASGDLLGAALICALRKRYPDLEVSGIGGPAMIEAGCNSFFDIEQLSVMGFFEPLIHLPRLIQSRLALYRYFAEHRPHVFIGIDAPDFNLGLEHKLRRIGIPTIHYVSPSVWAWRQYRIHKIKKAVDLMLTLFPFEKQFYEAHQMPVRYVGHPLANRIPLEIDKMAARRALCLDEEATYIALLPGSRRQEIARMAEPFLLAAKYISQKKPEVRFLTSHVNEARYQEFYASYQDDAKELPLTFFTDRSHDVMAASDVVVVTSGTATLEAMLYKKPMVITYRMSPVAYLLAKMLVKTKQVGLPNLLANERLVPELIQQAATPQNIADQVLYYLDHPEEMQRLEKRFAELHQGLRVDSENFLVDSVAECIKNKS